jgi:hypothetical protein
MDALACEFDRSDLVSLLSEIGVEHDRRAPCCHEISEASPEL